MKDYYKILEVSPTASTAEIKKSYRRLALQYHPDKNFGNSLYEAKFKEITEAYKILSDLTQRQYYNTQRSYKAEPEKKKAQPPVTAQSILMQTVGFRKKIAVLDPERMNKLALYQQIQMILSKHNITVLQQTHDTKLNRRLVEEILYCSRHLPFSHIEKICFQLTALAGTDNNMYRYIFNFSKESKRREYWNKYKLLVALFIAFVLCILIFIISENY